MKRITSILFVVFAFATVSLLVAQENQAIASPNVASAIAGPANTVNTGVTTEPRTTSGDQQLVTIPTETSESPAQAPADSKNKPVLDRQSNPDPAQNLIEYGGPG